MLINVYLSPHIVEIKIANFFNNKLYLNKNISINLPKNWYHSISINGIHSKYGIIDKEFILKNSKNGKNFFYTFFNKNNSGIIKFKDNLSYNSLQQYSKKEYNNQYCRFIAYHSGNKIHGIYIPLKESIVFFDKYDRPSKKFIEELCKD
jgi:hypothetical protein